MLDQRESIRPEIPRAVVRSNMTEAEQFQNKTLRPIAKMQHSLLIAVFQDYLEKKKHVVYHLSEKIFNEYLENTFAKDIAFRSHLKGLIIGHFTMEEYSFYISNNSEINKRITNLLKERLRSSREEFVK
ncbi:hypothetical protein BC781_101465 [Sediminitomix flava]|uniref:Glyoxalase n=2 Tax=Sediminitomix flava TaxID=379075 RepID=A0A315ZEY1_SEDFL|nr:hypothetical protein BC781_101465 [Sediminitomix flava]